MRFTCRECKDLKDVSFAVAHVVYSNGVGLCKPCHSHRVSIGQIEKKVKSRPESYLACNGCDRYVFRYISTTRPIHKEWEEITRCPYCSGVDLEELV